MSPDAHDPSAFPSRTTSPNFRLSLLCLLLIKAAVMIYVMFHSGIGLGPDEAQYWTWSQDLDWGYYSKPPGIAWQIFAGTYALGNSEFGVRLGALVVGLLLPYATFYLADRSGLKRATAFWAGTVMAFTPLGIMSSLLSTTDGGFVVFWTMALASLASSLQKQKVPNYVLIGILVLCGALFKWLAFVFWIVAIATAYVVPSKRSWKMPIGMAISLLALVPSVIWNMEHDWATFRHVWSTNIVGHGAQPTYWHPFKGNFFDFLGAQAALISPLFFIMLIIALVVLYRKRRKAPKGLLLCASVCTTLLAAYLFASIFKKLQGNWCVYAYPPAVVVLCWYASEHLHWGRPWLFVGMLCSIVMTSFILALPAIQRNSELTWLSPPYRINPFRHNVGWRQLEQELKAVAFNPEQYFLFGSRYQSASILSFYNETQERAYFFNISGARKNQFSYWPGMEEEQVGNTGFFVEIEQERDLKKDLAPRVKHFEELLAPYFKEVFFLGRRPLFDSYGTTVKAALIFQCTEYNGKPAPGSDKY